MPFEQLGHDRETPERPAVALLFSETQKKLWFLECLTYVLHIVLFFFNLPSLYVFLTKSPKKLVPELVL